MSEPTPEKRTTKLGQGIVTLTAFKGSKGLDKVKDNADIDAKKTEEEEWTGVGSIPRLGVKRRLTVRNSQPLTLQEKKEKKKIEGKKELHINDYVKKDPNEDSQRLIKIMSMYLCNNSTLKAIVNITTFIQMIFVCLKLSCDENVWNSLSYQKIYSFNSDSANEQMLAKFALIKVIDYYLKPIAATIYLIDLGLNLYTGVDNFFGSFFQLFDVCCCLPIIISQYVQYDGFIDLEWLIILKSVRFVLFYILQLSDQCDEQPELKKKFWIKHLVEMKLSIDTFRKSIQEVLLTVVLLFIVLLLFAMMAVEMCGRYSPNFSTIFDCLFSFWTAVTMDGWVDIMDTTQGTTKPIDYRDYFNYSDRQLAGFFASLIIISVILLGGFIFNNLFVALVTASLDEVVQEQKDKNVFNELANVHQMVIQVDPKQKALALQAALDAKEAARKAGTDEFMANTPGAEGQDQTKQNQILGPDGQVLVQYDKNGHPILQNDQSSEFAPILPLKEIQESYFPNVQQPIGTSQMAPTGINKLEEYLGLLHALESNLCNYQTLRVQLQVIYNNVHSLNDGEQTGDLDEARRIDKIRKEMETKAKTMN